MTNKPLPDRYTKQVRCAVIGERGQSAIREGRVMICGCGALGSVIANSLARAGVGFLRIVDRDFLELDNLQRQVLYSEQDVTDGLPKAIAAQRRLQAINSDITVDAVVADVNHTNVLSLMHGIDLVLDGTDNFETRFLINDAAHKLGIPWIYGGCVSAEGQSLTILPNEAPCFRCVVPEPPPAGIAPTCDSAGVIGPIVNVIASIQSSEALKLLVGDQQSLNRRLYVVDLWSNQARYVGLDAVAATGCATCQNAEYDWLDGDRSRTAAILCGRNAVQLATTASVESTDFDELERRLTEFGTVQRNPFLLRTQIDEFTITVFADGRAVIGGTDDPDRAKSVYARYVGN